ncbi:DUF2975 domain-containing protein [Nocardioides zeae]|uniref:DUF2975 domain-containing protein n=1 Tax=Nocardioides imazamoxiresistens TaxID=3231893 RepID=A0ABU3PZX7_9ACTN|nr:DUF2975 domain-containing protein [Nocardioides zeae]MDT9594774.1 DUF2975 domain-containing protein [Nocardioides zeae]
MDRWVVTALRAVIAVAFVGAVGVQVVIVPLAWQDLDSTATWVRVALTSIAVLGIGTLQVAGVCVWRLLTMVRRDTVFTTRAFRYVDGVVGAIASASVLVAAVAVVGAVRNRTTAGDEVAPGVVALMLGLALVVAGVALVVLVLRILLAKAVELRTELDVVI